MERSKVEECIHKYFAGAKNGQINLLKEGFHPDCKIYFIDPKGNLTFFTQTQFHQVVLENFEKAERKNQLLTLDITENIASAKVRADYPDFHFIDYLHLIKVKNDWKIISKVTVRKE